MRSCAGRGAKAVESKHGPICSAVTVPRAESSRTKAARTAWPRANPKFPGSVLVLADGPGEAVEVRAES